MSDTSVNFESFDIKKALQENENVDELVKECIEKEEVEKIEENLEKKSNDEKDEIEKSKHRLDSKKTLTLDYLKEVVFNFLTHFKKKIFVRSKQTKEVVEKEVVWYEYQTKKILQNKNPFIVVNFKDLVTFRSQILDKESISRVIYKLTNDPYLVRNIFTDCFKKIFDKVHKEELEEQHNLLAMNLAKKIQVGFNNFMEKPIQLNTLRSEHLSKFVTVEGVISQFDEVSRTRTITSYWQCDSCGREYEQKGARRPSKCISKDCASRSFNRDLKREVVEDVLDIQLTQQFGGIQKNSTVSRFVTIVGKSLVDHVLNNISPGQIAVINGVVTLAEHPFSGKETEDVSDIELDAFTIEQKNNVNIFDYDERLLNIVKDYINEQNIDAHVQKLQRSICPHIYKQEPIKQAVLLLLVGTNPRIRPDGTRTKGDINILNLGNSGIAKSDYGVLIQMVVPHSMKAGTKSSTSAAGLTSFVDKNPKTGKSMIALGVLALVDLKGVAIIEEINRRDKKDLHEFATATDDNQQIYVNKGGFHTVIYSRCPIYATANSLKNNGIWDDSKTIEEQTNIDRFILSRMDIIFVSHADRTREYKEKLMSHIEKEYDKSILEKDYENALEGKSNIQRTEEALKKVEISLRENDFNGVYPIEYLRHEIFYLKSIDCQLVPGSDAYKILRKFWIDYSSMNSLTDMTTSTDMRSEQAIMNMEADAVDIRKFSSLIKLSESFGRLYRSKTVQPKHANLACEIMALSLGSQIPKINTVSIEEQNEYVRKMMEKGTINKLADSMKREKKKLYDQAYVMFKSELTRFNVFAQRMGWETCKLCHGTGEQAEIIDSENKKMQMYECAGCHGRGGEIRGFFKNDLEANLTNKENNTMKHDRFETYFNVYLKKELFWIGDDNKVRLTIRLDTPEVIDSVKKIAERFAEMYMESVQKDEQIRAMNTTKKKKVYEFQNADEL